MGLLEFLASLVKSLAWPVVVGYCVYILRTPVGNLLGSVSKLKYGDLEAEFQGTLGRIIHTQKATTRQIGNEEKEAPTVALEDLAEISPRSAVLEAWIMVEKETVDFCKAHGLPVTLSYQGLFRLSKEKELDIEAFQTAYQELRLLRNKAVHATDAEITSETAKQYVKAANFIAAELNMRTALANNP